MYACAINLYIIQVNNNNFYSWLCRKITIHMHVVLYFLGLSLNYFLRGLYRVVRQLGLYRYRELAH